MNALIETVDDVYDLVTSGAMGRAEFAAWTERSRTSVDNAYSEGYDDGMDEVHTANDRSGE